MLERAQGLPREPVSGFEALPGHGLRGESGGAVLLGVKGVVVIGHGATSPEAVKNGTLVAARAVRDGLLDDVARQIGSQG